MRIEWAETKRDPKGSKYQHVGCGWRYVPETPEERAELERLFTPEAKPAASPSD